VSIPSIRNLLACCTPLAVAVSLCAAQGKQPKKKNGAPASGAQLYKQHCAVCHGNDGKGGGPPPATSPFTEPAPDLTTLARRHEGKFPDVYVADVLRSGVKLPDHGAAEMPVWGTIFESMTKSDAAQVNLRVTNLTNYLKSIQAK